MAGKITSSNAIIFMSVPGLFDTPQQMQGFAADDVFSADPINSSEMSMGVDGRLSAGFVYVPVVWNISLQADSVSNDFFDQWFLAQQVGGELLPGTGYVLLSSIDTKWNMTRGFLTSYAPMPDAGKILKPRKYGVTFQNIAPAVV